ncbi:MAG: ribonuclease HI family protein [Ignavibacteriales bacterium]|nr:ribonuclease HI family protein [Ignavibacteriales bacterium]
MTVHAFTDGASRGNPGEAGIGVVLKDEKGKKISSVFGFVGSTTNNVAEYKALIVCLKLAVSMKCDSLVVHSDSELMVRQVKGEYKVKDPEIRKHFQDVFALLEKAPYEFEILHIARDDNAEADRLANLGIETRRPLKV